MLKILVVSQSPSANKYLPTPLVIGEKVIVVGNMDEDQYIKVRHNKGQSISIFNKGYFSTISGNKIN